MKDYKLTRAVINVDMVKDINGKKEFPLGENKIGYVRLVQFGEKTSADLEAALKKLKKQGMQALILDLRWNPGGLLEQAVDVCEKFLPRGELVVTTEGRNPSQNSVRRGDGARRRIAQHADGGAGQPGQRQRLGDRRRLPAGPASGRSFWARRPSAKAPCRAYPCRCCRMAPALRLTTAKYYTPSHKVIHEEGITPDIVVPMTEEQERDMQLKLTPGGVESLDDEGPRAGAAAPATRNWSGPWTCSKASRSSPSAPRRRTKRGQGRRWRRNNCAVRCRPTAPRCVQREPVARRAPLRLRPRHALLAFETSCDETSAAVVHEGRVLSNVVSSQISAARGIWRRGAGAGGARASAQPAAGRPRGVARGRRSPPTNWTRWPPRAGPACPAR